MKKIIQKFALISLVLTTVPYLNGCLESSEDSTKEPIEQRAEPQSKVAYYYANNKAIQGIYYECGIYSGITDKKGKFIFEVGEDCSFYLLEKEEFKIKEIASSLLSQETTIQESDENLRAFLGALSIERAGELQIDRERISRLMEANIVEVPSISEDIERVRDIVTQESKEEMEQRVGIIVEEYPNMTLTWEDTPHTTQAGNWYDAMEYCSELNHAGLSDWGLPEKDILVSLDISRFTHKVLGAYWSATEYEAYQGQTDFLEAYLIDFEREYGIERGYVLKTNINPFTRCVSTSTPPAMSNIEAQEEVILTPSCQEVPTIVGEIGYGTFEEGLSYCSTLNASLPTIEQMEYLYEQNSTHPNDAVGLWSATLGSEEGTHLSVYFLEDGIEEIPMFNENGRSYLCIESSCKAP